LRLGARDRWQNDQAGVNIDAAGELSEIIGVFGDDDAVCLNSAREDDVIGIAQPAAIARMDRIVQTVLVEMLAERRRNARR
jgi:hypothetical protein